MLKYQFPSERGWRGEANLFQLPKNVYFPFGQKFSSNSRPSRNLYDRLSPPKRWSLNPLNPFRVEENLMATFGHQIHGIYNMNGKQPSGEIPSYVSKFVNHLMIGGKKGVAIHLFVAALHLFLKRLEEEKRLDGLGKRSFPIKDTTFYPLLHTTSVANARSERSPSMAGGSLAAPSRAGGSLPAPGHRRGGLRTPGHRRGNQRIPSKSLILPVNSWGPSSFLQRPGKNLLGLSFSPPSTFFTDGRISFFASSLKKQVTPNLFEKTEDKVFQKTLPFTRDTKPSRKHLSIMQESCISMVSPPFALNCQGLTYGEKHSVVNGRSSNTLLFEPVGKNKAASNSSFQDQVIREKESSFFSLKKKLQPFNPGVCNTELSSYKHPSLLSCLEFAVKNVEPTLEVRKKKIAGITRQIPCIVAKPRGQGLAIRWIISAAQEKRRKEGKAFHKSLAEELVNAYHKRGEPRQKRDSLHRVAESNRSFLRYRWW